MNGKMRIGLMFTVALLAGGCAAIPAHRGYVADAVLVDAVHPGIDNRTSVEQTLGRPSFSSQFGDPVWYYVSSTTAEKPFNTPKITQHMVLAVHFDPTGNVSALDRSGIDQVVRLEPEDDATPTLGRDRGLLEDLFGNIGQVGGAVGAGS